MDGNDMEVVPGSVVTDGDVERSVGLHHRHQQTLWEGLSPRSLLDDFALVDDSKGPLPSNPALVCSEERMVPSLDASGPRCSANGVKGNGHTR